MAFTNTTVNKYLVKCLTEGFQIATDYRTSEPTVCPNNSEHIIDNSNFPIIDTIQASSVEINQEITSTPYRIRFFDPVFATGTTDNSDFIFPYDISLHSATVYPTDENLGDKIVVCVNSNGPVGYLTSELGTGGSVMYINPETITRLHVGYMIYIDGVQIGEIIDIDVPGVSITLGTGVSETILVGTTIDIIIPLIENLTFFDTKKIVIGEGVINTVLLRKDTSIDIHYENNGTEDHKLNYAITMSYMKHA